MGEDSIQSADLTGKRCTKKVTPAEGKRNLKPKLKDFVKSRQSGLRSIHLTKFISAEGAISWDTVADAGEVDQDEEDQENPNRELTNKNVNIWQLSLFFDMVCI